MINPTMPDDEPTLSGISTLKAAQMAIDLREVRIAELEAQLAEAERVVNRGTDKLVKERTENASLLEEINTLDAKVDQALEWQGQAMVRAERAEDLQEQAEREIAGLSELAAELGHLRRQDAHFKAEREQAMESVKSTKPGEPECQPEHRRPQRSDQPWSPLARPEATATRTSDSSSRTAEISRPRTATGTCATSTTRSSSRKARGTSLHSRNAQCRCDGCGILRHRPILFAVAQHRATWCDACQAVQIVMTAKGTQALPRTAKMNSPLGRALLLRY